MQSQNSNGHLGWVGTALPVARLAHLRRSRRYAAIVSRDGLVSSSGETSTFFHVATLFSLRSGAGDLLADPSPGPRYTNRPGRLFRGLANAGSGFVRLLNHVAHQPVGLALQSNG